jgi:hypothetical protein
METSTLLVIQCVAFVIILLAVYYYFNRKLQYHMMAIESLQHQILEQQRVLERHDKLFRHLVGPSVYASIPETTTPPTPVVTANNNIRGIPSFGGSSGGNRGQNCTGGVCFLSPQQAPQSPPPPPTPPMPTNPLMSMGPMVSGLLGVLNSMSGAPSAGGMMMNGSRSGPVIEEEEDDSPDIDEDVLDQELRKELDELRESEDKKIHSIKEGRLDEPPLPVTTVDEIIE